MNNYPVDMNTKLDAVYYNMGKFNLYMVRVGDIVCMKLDQINGRLNHEDTRRVCN